jgi:hypothetical protein
MCVRYKEPRDEEENKSSQESWAAFPAATNCTCSTTSATLRDYWTGTVLVKTTVPGGCSTVSVTLENPVASPTFTVQFPFGQPASAAVGVGSVIVASTRNGVVPFLISFAGMDTEPENCEIAVF